MSFRYEMRLSGEGGQGLVLIDTTTADPIMSEALAMELEEKGIKMLDATISGTPKMCAERDITFMVGGDEKTFKEHESIFSILMGMLTFTIWGIFLAATIRPTGDLLWMPFGIHFGNNFSSPGSSNRGS